MRVRSLPNPVMGMGSPLSLARTKGVGVSGPNAAPVGFRWEAVLFRGQTVNFRGQQVVKLVRIS